MDISYDRVLLKLYFSYMVNILSNYVSSDEEQTPVTSIFFIIATSTYIQQANK